MNPVSLTKAPQSQSSGSKSVEKRPSFLERCKKAAEKTVDVLKTFSLFSGVFKCATAIASCVVKLSKPIKHVLTALKVPSIVQKILSTGLSAEKVHASRLLVRDLTSACRLCHLASDPAAKSAALQNALNTIDQHGLKEIGTMTMLKKNGIKDLKKRVDSLREHLKTHTVTADDEELVKLLASRAKVQLSFEISQISSRCAGIVGGVLGFVTLPVSGQIVTAAILAACAVQELAVWGAKSLFINQNPFDPESKSPAKAAVEKISKSFQSLVAKIQTSLFSKKRYVTA